MRSVRLLLLAAVALASCKRSPMGHVEAIRDALERDAPSFDDALAACNATAAAKGCGPEVAQSIGGTFDAKKPDQISAAAVAVIVARDRRGSAVGAPDVWLAAMRKATGPGADALRLATALAMSRVADKHARALDTDADARAFLADVAASIPGACATYEALGAGANVDTMAPVDSPDHSACVQRDLSRKEGPGGGYGQGLFRGAAGALALWKDAASALHDGAAVTKSDAKAALEKRLATIDAATPKIAPKVVEAPAGNSWTQMESEHNARLVGGSADAGAPKLRP